MQPLPRQKRKKAQRDAAGSARVVGDIAELAVQPMIAQPSQAKVAPSTDDADALSDDFEWDSDFGAANNNPDENRTLLTKTGVATLTASGTLNCER